MKSLIKNTKATANGGCCEAPKQVEAMVAQCCAKVSKTVAGCHD